MYWKKISLGLFPLIVFAIYFKTIFRPSNQNGKKTGTLVAFELHSDQKVETKYWLEQNNGSKEELFFRFAPSASLIGHQVEVDFLNQKNTQLVKEIKLVNLLPQEQLKNEKMLVLLFKSNNSKVPLLTAQDFANEIFNGEFNKKILEKTNIHHSGKVIGWINLNRTQIENGGNQCQIKNQEIAQGLIDHYENLKNYGSLMVLFQCDKITKSQTMASLSKVNFLGKYLNFMSLVFNSNDWTSLRSPASSSNIFNDLIEARSTNLRKFIKPIELKVPEKVVTTPKKVK